MDVCCIGSTPSWTNITNEVKILLYFMVKPWTSLDSKVSFVSNKSVIKCRQLFFFVFFDETQNGLLSGSLYCCDCWKAVIGEMSVLVRWSRVPCICISTLLCSGFLRLNRPPLPPAKKCTYILNANVKPHSIFNGPTATKFGQDSCCVP